MAFLFKYFTSKPKPIAPERVPTDTVIPLSNRDDTWVNRSISLEFTMKFDEVLDADNISSALWNLLDRPGWRKLGARLRLNDKGKLEYHIPAQFTRERPPINCTHTIESMPISQHPLGSQLPVANGKLQIFDDLGHFRFFSPGGNKTTLLADWIYTDQPQLGLHIVSFNDTTLVTITWLHTLLDIIGQNALLTAWMAVLDGRQEDVPEFVGYDTDPLADLGKPVDKETQDGGAPKHEEHVLKNKRVTKLGMYKFIFNYLWELFWYPVEESRVVVIPASSFSKIKAKAFADLETLDPSQITYTNTSSTSTLDSDAKPKPFLSDGDILTAWFTRLIITTNPSITSSPPTRLINIMNVFGMRDVLRTSSPPYAALLPPAKEGAYISNCASSIISLFTLQEYLSLPLGHVAARIRKDLVTQGTRAQIEAFQHINSENGEQQLYGEGGMVMCTITNWTKAKLFETDFSAAIVEESKVKKGERARGKPSFIHAWATTAKGLALRGSGSCIGKDTEGNWWLGVLMRKELVPNLVKAVEGMQ